MKDFSRKQVVLVLVWSLAGAVLFAVVATFCQGPHGTVDIAGEYIDNWVITLVGALIGIIFDLLVTDSQQVDKIDQIKDKISQTKNEQRGFNTDKDVIYADKWICSGCGTENEIYVSFCKKCKKPLEETT